jgi:diguanylate cyclase (GGDEF)-like protein
LKTVRKPDRPGLRTEQPHNQDVRMECRAADIAVPIGTQLRIPRRTRLVLALCIVAPALLVGFLSYQAMRIQLNAQVQSRLAENARSYGLSVFARLAAADQRLLQIAEAAPANTALSQNIFTSVQEWHPGLEGGELEASHRTSELIASATALKDAGIDATVVFEHDDSQPMPVLVRRLSAREQTYVIGRLRPDYLWGNPEQVAGDTRFCIAAEGAFKYCPSEGEPKLAAEDRVSVRWPLCLKGRFGIAPWVIEASEPRALALTALHSLRDTLAALLMVTLTLALVIGCLEMRRIRRPLDAVLAALARLGRGDLARSPEGGAGDEFRELRASIDLTAATLKRQSDLLITLGEIDRKILSADSLDAVIAWALPRVPAAAAAAGAALLLVTDEGEAEGLLHALLPAGGIVRQPCKLDLHDLQRVLEDEAPLSLAAAPMLPVAQLQEAGFETAFCLPLRDGVRLIGALLLLDPEVVAGWPIRRRALSLADRLSVAISHAHRKRDLLRSAYFDPLTGLANRELLCDRIGQALGVDGKRRSAALMLIGIDRFKNINDTLGHRAGDELLKRCAERLRAAIGSGDTIARLTGDEFIVLKPGSDPAAVVTLAEAVAHAFTKPFEADGIGYVLSVSIGIAMAPGDGLAPDVLIRKADIAMRRAKSRAGGGVVFFEETMNEQAKQRFRLEHSLRAAWEQDDFAVHFQPKIELATGRVVGAEALLRWTHPTDGPIAPGVFIPIVEETGLIVPLGYWVIEQACRHLTEWRRAGLSVAHVAVNLSLRQLSDPGFIEEVAKRLGAAGLPRGALELEVTETTVAEHAEQLPGLLQQLRDLGVRIAIDDFGTGYSSLAMLRVLPIDVLKVDRAFVSAMEPGGTGDAIASAIIAMGRILGKDLVAEGVESAAQAEVLRERGCPVAQGFYFSKALPPEEFLAYCRGREIQLRQKRYA